MSTPRPALLRRPVARTAAALMLAGVGALAAPAALAQAAAPTSGYSLAAQPLDQALAALARQAGLQLLVPAELVRGRQGRAVDRAGDLGAALNALLAGSGLQGRIDGTTLVVEPLPPALPPSDAAILLPDVRANAAVTRETGTGPVQGYRATRSQTATKTDTPVMDTPVSVQTVSRELMDDQKVRSVKDAVANVSGVYQQHGPDGNTMDSFVVRGFSVDSYGATYLDGVKDFSRSPKETAGLERIEVLKGPAAIMYGRIEPGGLINRVSKRPQAEALTTLEQEVGSHRHSRTSLDSTGAVGNGSAWLYRVNAVFEDEDGFKDDTHNRRVFFAPQVEWRPDTDTSVRVGLDYMRDKRSWALTYGTIGNAQGPVDIPISSNLHGKDDHYRDESAALKLDWSHRLNDSWTLQQRVTFLRRKGEAHGTGLGSADEDGDYTRDYWGWENERTDVFSTNLELLGKLTTGDVKHTLLLGGDWFDEDYDSGGWAFGGTVVNANIHAPRRDDQAYRLDYTVMPYQYRNRNAGLYLQDQIALLDDRFHVMLGVRYDHSDYTYQFDTAHFHPVDKKATWRAGLLYKIQPSVSVYASYVTGFGQSQFDWASGSLFEPQTSKQFEVGLKLEPLPDFGVTVAAFELIKDNLTMADPADPLRTILAGEATSRGIELDLSGRLTRNWDVAASYAYTDVSYTRSDTMQGERLMGVPRHGASLWSSYRFGGSGWKAGAGVIARSSILGTQRAWDPALYPYTLAGYAILNAMVACDFRLGGHAAHAQLNVANLTDKRYNPTTYGGQDRIGLGEPRSVVASLSISF